VLEMDEVKLDVEEEAFAEVARGDILTYAASVEPLKQYRFRVMAVNEQQLESVYSLTSTYWSADLPEAITFPESSFTEI
jgi:hypothetical protein